MKIDILTLFPEMFEGPFSESMIKRAQEKNLIEINIRGLRDWATDKHNTVDDKPYSGGAGMVLKVDIVDGALQELKSTTSTPQKVRSSHLAKSKRDDKVAIKSLPTSSKSKHYIPNAPHHAHIVLLSPQGRVFNQQKAKELSKIDHLILIAGHYEGFDQRIRDHLIDEEISIGDYVLTGGELPAMVMVDSVARLIPGVLGDKDSLKDETHSQKGSKKYPVYTRPEDYKGWKVPEVLLSGNHAEIEKWKRKTKK